MKKTTKKKAYARRKTSLRTRVLQLLILMGLVALLVKMNLPAEEGLQAPAHTGEYGNLLRQTTAPGTTEQLKSYEGMDISFNADCRIPNWVAWELTGEEADGKEPRDEAFVADPDVKGCPETWEYKFSGYDRGHMAPAGDMKWSKKAQRESFTLTNICPQEKSLNAGAWKTLEEKCRVWARAMGRIYIVCGPVIDGHPKEYIGDERIYVPNRFFKAVIQPDRRMGIGFIMPNSKVKGGMQTCVVSIDSIEALTGHDLFPSLPDALEAEIEAQADFRPWNKAH